MKVIYAVEDYEFSSEKSIFLAGPTPRSPNVKSWRPEAISLLENNGFDGAVFVPETEDGEWKHTYVDQIEWEHKMLDGCSFVLMWVPRELKDMPAFCTNIEFGMYIESDRLIYGRPDEAPKMTYMDYCYEKFTGHKPEKILSKLVEKTLSHIRGI